MTVIPFPEALVEFERVYIYAIAAAWSFASVWFWKRRAKFPINRTNSAPHSPSSRLLI
jgi:hypothetical protein